jgi:hypothetical protein
MHAKLVLVAAAIATASAAVAQGVAAPSSVTASAARKAHVLRFSDGDQQDILSVDAGPNDSLTAIEIVKDSMAIKIPGDTISAGDKSRELKTSLTSKDVTAHR